MKKNVFVNMYIYIMINIRYLYIQRRKLHDSAKMLNFF